jgi:hypothetical protein
MGGLNLDKQWSVARGTAREYSNIRSQPQARSVVDILR